jgi:hypothetical protein
VILANTAATPTIWFCHTRCERAARQPTFPIFASAKDKFFLKIVDAQLDFERGAGGKVVAVVLHQNGRDIRAQPSPDTSGYG